MRMNEQELTDKLVHWCLIFMDMNKGRIPLDRILKKLELELTCVAHMQSSRRSAEAARRLGVLRTTLWERMKRKGRLTEEELKEICLKHALEYSKKK